MFDPFDREDSDLESEITRLHSLLCSLDPTEEAYQKTSQQLTHLYKLRYDRAELNLKSKQQFAEHQLKQDESRWQEELDQRSWFERVDPSAVVTVAGNLVVALIVVKYEQTGVISTQVRNFIRKI